MIQPRLHALRKARFVLVVFLAFSLLCLAFAVWPPGVTYAGKEGVFINDSVYFTLEDVTLSKGSDTQTMRFRIDLNNGGDSAIDFNRYGVRATSAAGGSYYAELTRRADAQVQPHTAASYYYVATVPGALDAGQLRATVFERNGSAMRDLGSLSAANAQSLREQAHQLVVNAADVDPALTGNAFLAFQAVKAAALPQNGKWTVALDMTVAPAGSESVTLPSGLKYLLADGAGNSFAMTATAVEGSTINAGQTKHVLLTATTETKPETAGLALELSRGTSGLSSLGKLALAPLFQLTPPGERVSYALQGREGITLEVQKAEKQTSADKTEVLVTAVLRNDGKTTIQAPSLQGTLVSLADAISVKAETVVTPETYIAAGDYGVYRFAAQLPDGSPVDLLQFVVAEPYGTSASGSASSSAGGTAASSGTQTGGSQSGSTPASASSSDSPFNAVPVLAVSLAGGLSDAGDMASVPAYRTGQPFSFEGGSRLIDPNLEVSVVEFSGHTNAENGYQTVVAKFKFLNKSSDTLNLPAFDTSLTDAAGTSYPGSRQTTALTQLIPNSAYVYSYSYMLPPNATGEFKLNILDTSNASKIKVPIASYRLAVEQTGEDDPYAVSKELSFYPFHVKIEDWRLNSLYSSGSYTYRLQLNLDIQKTEQVIVDDSFSKLEFELVDATNRVLGSTTQTLQGVGKLISGSQTVDFANIKTDQFQYPVTVHMYENIATASGTARRLVATLKQ